MGKKNTGQRAEVLPLDERQTSQDEKRGGGGGDAGHKMIHKQDGREAERTDKDVECMAHISPRERKTRRLHLVKTQGKDVQSWHGHI